MHALTREVVYGSVPKARRAKLHALIAAWLERTGSGRDEDAALLRPPLCAGRQSRGLGSRSGPTSRRSSSGCACARHELAPARRRARDQTLRPGRGCCQPAACARALRAARTLELWREIGHASALKFDGERFWEAMKRALKLTDDPEVQADILADLACQTSIRSGMLGRCVPTPKRSQGWIRQALELARPDRAEAYARALIARAYWNPSEEACCGARGERARRAVRRTLPSAPSRGARVPRPPSPSATTTKPSTGPH